MHSWISALIHDQTFVFFSRRICSSAFSLHLNDVFLSLSNNDKCQLNVLAKTNIFFSLSNNSRCWFNVLARINIFFSFNDSSKSWLNVLAKINVFLSFSNSSKSQLNVLAKADVLLTRNNNILKSSLRLFISSREFLQSLRNFSDSFHEH